MEHDSVKLAFSLKIIWKSTNQKSLRNTFKFNEIFLKKRKKKKKDIKSVRKFRKNIFILIAIVYRFLLFLIVFKYKCKISRNVEKCYAQSNFWYLLFIFGNASGNYYSRDKMMFQYSSWLTHFNIGKISSYIFFFFYLRIVNY